LTSNATSIRWWIVFLLLLSVGINYIDRGSLSVAAPVLTTEFDLQPDQMGLLLSGFFWSYAVFQLVSGWLVDRFDVKWVFAAGFCVWSLAMAGTGIVGSFVGLVAARVILGIGESVAYPAISQIIVRHFAQHERGLPNAIIDVGTKVGPALSTMIGGLVVTRYGWRALFIVMGIGALFWLIPWLWLMPARGSREVQRESAGPTLAELLCRRELWGTSLTMFSLGYVWYFLLTWLPSYLVNGRGFPMERMAVLGSLPFWVMALATLTGGWLADRWIARGASPTWARRTIALTGLSACGVFILPVGYVPGAEMALGLLIASCAALGFFTSNVWAMTQTLAGSEAAGKWSGVQNFIGNLGGVFSPLIAGFIVKHTGAYGLAFGAASVVIFAGVVSHLLFVKEIAPVKWGTERGVDCS
jgi:MFS family permease